MLSRSLWSRAPHGRLAELGEGYTCIPLMPSYQRAVAIATSLWSAAKAGNMMLECRYPIAYLCFP